MNEDGLKGRTLLRNQGHLQEGQGVDDEWFSAAYDAVYVWQIWE